MRPVEELINLQEPAWTNVKTWIDSAENNVEILPANREKSKSALFNTQITTRSPMGAIVFETGGILINSGLIRILGSGSEKLKRTLPDWNKGKTFKEFGEAPGYLLVADDVFGGFFALNGGILGEDLGRIYYLSPETLEFEPLGWSYTDFLFFCFSGDLNQFYSTMKWKDLQKDISNMSNESVLSFFPYLWTKEGENLETTVKKPVPIEEQFNLNIEFRKQLGLEK